MSLLMTMEKVCTAKENQTNERARILAISSTVTIKLNRNLRLERNVSIVRKKDISEMNAELLRQSLVEIKVKTMERQILHL